MFWPGQIGSGHSLRAGHPVEILRVDAEWFKDIRPVITMMEINRLARVDRLVEVKVEAFVGSYSTSQLTEQRPI